MKPCPHKIEDVLPHAHPMILLDEITGYGEQSIQTRVTVRPASQFYRPDRGIPAHISLEWMAQTCGAYAGVRGREGGKAVRVGLLLGTRDFVASVAWFTDGQCFDVQATKLFEDGQIGAFDCAVRFAGHSEPVVTARLTVFQPEDASALLAGQIAEVNR